METVELTGPHAEITPVDGRWLMRLVGCHRELEVTFKDLGDAMRVSVTLVETAVRVSEMRDLSMLEASA